MNFSRDQFFAGYRNTFGSLRQEQVEGLNFLLDAIEKDRAWLSVHHIAYFLATVKHEAADTYQPIKERRGRPGSAIRKIQDRYWNTGYYGRGYVQITHKRNYEQFGIADNPDKALEPETAYRIAADGMRKGIFTGKKLSDYINERGTDYRNARRIVNGTDRADDIAELAEKFEGILKASLSSVRTAETARVEVDSAPQPAPSPVNVQHADAVTTSSDAAPIVKGDPPTTPPIQVTNSSRARIYAALGATLPVLTALWGWIQNNSNIVAVAVICIAALAAMLIFRNVIIEIVRAYIASSPDKYNVK